MLELKCIIIDVDGTMTDGGVYYDENGNEMKKFSTRDAAGFFAASRVGIRTVVLTGRECKATAKRLGELGADYVFQSVKNKADFLADFMDEKMISKNEIGYIGDDLNDLAAMGLCGYVGCPADSCREVMSLADYVSPVCGGHGAVRDVIEHYLCERGLWSDAVCAVYGTGV